MTEREMFENFLECCARTFDLSKWEDGNYEDDTVQQMWVGWQARAEACTHKAIYEDEVCSE